MKTLSLTAALAVTASASSAHAQALSFGIDGGVTYADPDIAFVGPAADNETVNIALGMDIAGYETFGNEYAIGLALTPTFYAAGPKPSTGINFMLSPRFVYRPSWFHLAIGAGPVLSVFEDRCSTLPTADFTPNCPRTLKATGVALGVGANVRALFRVWKDGGLDVLIGPEARYQWANFGYEDTLDGDGGTIAGEGGYDMHVIQGVFALRAFVDLFHD